MNISQLEYLVKAIDRVEELHIGRALPVRFFPSSF